MKIKQYAIYLYLLPIVTLLVGGFDFLFRWKMADVLLESQRTNILILNIREIANFSKPIEIYFEEIKLSDVKEDYLIWSKIDKNIWFNISFQKNIFSKITDNTVLFRLTFTYNFINALFMSVIVWFILSLVLLKVIDRERSNTLSLVKAQKSILRAEALADVALMVSHDIKTPLTAIQLVLSVAKELGSEKSSIIKESIDRIKNVVKDLDKINKMELDKGEAPINKNEKSVTSDQLFEVIKSVKKYCDSTSIKSNHVRYKINNFVKTPKIIECDDLIKLERILINLVKNSQEAIAKKGSIEILLDQVDAGLTISIKDDGKGVDSETFQKIGTKGFSYGKVEGSGYGIYDAIESLKAWGGSFEMQSYLGRGTVVVITFKELYK